MKKMKNKAEHDIFMIKAGVVITVILMVGAMFGIIYFRDHKDLPKAETLLQYVEVPQIPYQIDEDTIKELIFKDASVTLDGRVDIRLVEKHGADTEDYTVKCPITGSLATYVLEDESTSQNRAVISVGASMDYGIEGPYIIDQTRHNEKSYFLVMNESLDSVNAYMRHNEYTVSENEAVTQDDMQGKWQYANEHEIDIQGFIEQWNADHEEYIADNSAALQEGIEKARALIAKNATVTQGNYRGTDCYVLNVRLDMTDLKARGKVQELFRYFESVDPTFMHWNISQFLDYYGDFIVLNAKIFFVPVYDEYYPMAYRLDLSELKLKDFLSHYSGVSLKKVEDTVTIDVNSLYVDLIVLPYIEDHTKAEMQYLIDYTDQLIQQKQNEGSTGSNGRMPVGINEGE